MSIEVFVTDNFRRKAKRLLKKYRSLEGELQELVDELLKNPNKGSEIKDNVYKIRLAVKSKGKGKSGGMRVVTYLHFFIQKEDEEDTEVYLLSIYDKSEYESIPEKLLLSLVEEVQTAIEERKTREDSNSE